MDKDKILSRLNAKDYNNELETILEEKNFSEDVKNLLLSMLYKIEAGYADYIITKRVVQNKREYIEDILDSIKNETKQIEIIEEKEETSSYYKIDKFEKTITLIHPNEKQLLYALYELGDRQMYLDEKYTLIRVGLSKLINLGENSNHTEVLRDFNGWSWNTLPDEIISIPANLVYQNLIYLLGIEFMEYFLHTNEVTDRMKKLEETLEATYGEENTKRLLEELQVLSILVGTQHEEKEVTRLLEEKEELENELERLKDKKKLLEDISKQKKEALNAIKEIDSILNDKKRLEEEYITRNEKLPEYNKIFSLTHLTEILTRQRRKIMSGIEEANKVLEPAYYVKVKGELEKQVSLLENVTLEGEKREGQIFTHLLALQKIFLDCLEMKVKQVTEKEDIIDVIYMLRYYYLLYISKEKQIKDKKELMEKSRKIERQLFEKGYILKVVTQLSEDKQIDINLWEKLISSRLINLEALQIIIVMEQGKIQVEIYDGEILEDVMQTDIIDKKGIRVKLGKKVKLLS